MSEIFKRCDCASTGNDAQLIEEFNEILETYRNKPGGVIPVMQIAQNMFGYLPENVLKQICRVMNKSYSEIAGIAGFYSFFSTTPRGKHIIRVCLGTACYVRGGKQILEALRQELSIDVGETTEDRLFSLEVARCFGACGLAPVITVDEDIHQRVKVTKLREILSKYRKPAPDEKEI